MNSKELVERLIKILTEAANRRINLLSLDEQGNTVCIGQRAMDSKETFEFIIDRLYAVKDELEFSEDFNLELENSKWEMNNEKNQD